MNFVCTINNRYEGTPNAPQALAVATLPPQRRLPLQPQELRLEAQAALLSLIQSLKLEARSALVLLLIEAFLVVVTQGLFSETSGRLLERIRGSVMRLRVS